MEEKFLVEEDVKVERFSAHKTPFPKANRLRRRFEYVNLFKKSSRLVGKYICLDYLFIPESKNKLGITVSTRYGKAHERNRFKRCVRESFRQLLPHLPQNICMNIIPRFKAKFASSTEILQEIQQLLSLTKE